MRKEIARIVFSMHSYVQETMSYADVVISQKEIQTNYISSHYTNTQNLQEMDAIEGVKNQYMSNRSWHDMSHVKAS